MPGHDLGEAPVSAFSHLNVVSDIHNLPCETCRKKAGNKEGKIAQPLQEFDPQLGVGAAGPDENERERLLAETFRRVSVKVSRRKTPLKEIRQIEFNPLRGADSMALLLSLDRILDEVTEILRKTRCVKIW